MRVQLSEAYDTGQEAVEQALLCVSSAAPVLFV